MRIVSRTFALLVLSCLCLNMQAQYDDSYEVEEWSLDIEEEETPKPQHKEYKNAAYLQYSPSRYKVSDDNNIRFNEFLMGYNRIIQVVEKKPYFVEVGANAKFSWARNPYDIFVLTFHIPVNVLYKIYLSGKKDYAIAPFAGASLRAIAVAHDYSSGDGSTNLCGDGGWKNFQIAWQTGLRFYINRYYLGVSYSRDFRDNSKFPSVRECGIHMGYCF